MDEFVCGTNMPLVRAQCRIDYLEKQLETYAKPVEMTQKQRDFIVEQVELGNNTEDGMHFWKTNELFFNVNPDDMMRAWLNTDVIKVVE